MAKRRDARESSGPFHVGMLAPGDRYELSDGHAYYAAPVGGDGARGTLVGAQVLDTDPAVKEAGIDAGFTLGPGDLLAPDVAVGNVPDAPGWIAGVPPLAVEYAGRGQDEGRLQEKIGTLLDAGTRWVWVVRLLGPRRVEVYEKGTELRVLGPGAALVAPGVLQNAVPVEALYDREVAHEATLRNLLQRRGYADLEKVREEGREEGREAGREEGREAGLAEAVLLILARRGLMVTEEQRVRLRGCRDRARLDRWIGAALGVSRADELFED